VKLSVRPVLVRVPGTSALVWHSKQPFDQTDALDRINTIWIPQANVAFTCRDTTPVPIIDEEKIARAYGFYRDTSPLPQVVVIDSVRDMLNDSRDKSADFTMFLVEQSGRLSTHKVNVETDSGVTDHEFPVALISDSRVIGHETMAHEAGHFLGKLFNGGKNFGHLDASVNPLFIDCLMKLGGASPIARIPFDDAVNNFNQPGTSYK